MTRREKLLLIGKLCATIVTACIGGSEVLCLRQESTQQTVTLQVLFGGMVAAFTSYWILWVSLSEAQFTRYKCWLLFYLAVFCSISRVIYMKSLCHYGQHLNLHVSG
jgi:energy-converting hydrogenase Eha subunit C